MTVDAWTHREVVDMARYILEADPETSDHSLGRQLREWAAELMPQLAPEAWEGMEGADEAAVGAVVRERVRQKPPRTDTRSVRGGHPR